MIEQVGENHDDTVPEHYETLVQMPKWQWLQRDGKIVDLRRKIYMRSMPWAVNILTWMEKHHTDNTPYMSTEQYHYIEDRINMIKNKSAAVFRSYR